MGIKKALADNNVLRGMIIPILRRLNFEVRWTHDVTKRKFHLLTYLHKGYWYFGSRREENELNRFKDLINEGDTVLEVGAHIGYVSQIFEDLVGETGRVIVAEPTEFSRRFLSKNIRSDTMILSMALSSTVGEMDFYTEEFGGFTNSLVPEYTENTSKGLSQSQHSRDSKIIKTKVNVSTIDTICRDHSVTPHFIKIDVEGAELDVLKGASKTLNKVSALMVEVSRHHEDVFDLLSGYDFKAHNSAGEKIVETFPTGNIFFIKDTLT